MTWSLVFVSPFFLLIIYDSSEVVIMWFRYFFRLHERLSSPLAPSFVCLFALPSSELVIFKLNKKHEDAREDSRERFSFIIVINLATPVFVKLSLVRPLRMPIWGSSTTEEAKKRRAISRSIHYWLRFFCLLCAAKRQRKKKAPSIWVRQRLAHSWRARRRLTAEARKPKHKKRDSTRLYNADNCN